MDSTTPTPADSANIDTLDLQRIVEERQKVAAHKYSIFLSQIKSYRTGKSDDATNIIDQGARLTYSLPNDELAKLMWHLESCRKEDIVLHISERQGSEKSPKSGIMLDFDMVISESSKNPLTVSIMQRLSACITRILFKDLKFPVEEGAAVVHLFFTAKSQSVQIDNGHKYGFHMLMPGIRVTRGYKKFLIHQLRNDQSMQSVLSTMHITGTPQGRPPAECLDLGSASVPVLFLGSCKRGGEPYKLHGAYTVSCDAQELLIGRSYPVIQVIDNETLEKYNLVYELNVGLSVPYELIYKDDRRPLVDRVDYNYKEEIMANVEDYCERSAGNLIAEEELQNANRELDDLIQYNADARLLHQMLDILDPVYYIDYTRWRDVIFALANTSKDYKPLAVWFSQKSATQWAQKGSTSLDRLWDDALTSRRRFQPLTSKSIMYWAQKCSPGRFSNITENSYFLMLSKYVYKYAGAPEHYCIAKVLHSMLGNRFATDTTESTRRHQWYEFIVPNEKNAPGTVWKWRPESTPDDLSKYISERLVTIADDILKHLDDQRNNADESMAKPFARMINAFKVTQGRLNQDTFKNGIINQAAVVFRKRGFIESLDKHPDILGVGNGVLQLASPYMQNNKLINHYHEWPVSLYTPVVYSPFNPTEHWTSLMLRAMRDIIPEYDARLWIMFYLSTALYRGMKEPILLLWTGAGCNAKTFVMNMMNTVLGDNYATKLNISLLTAGREAPDRPNSALMRLKNRGFGYFEESNNHDILDTARLKEIVNPGDITTRDLNQKQESFELCTTLIAASNHDFVIQTTDHGTWRRIRRYQSRVRFCANPDPGNPYEKKEDSRYVREYTKDPDCKMAFLSILAYFWERLQREYDGNINNVPSPTIYHETEKFRNSQDFLNRFITERIVLSPNTDIQYTLSHVATVYTDWYVRLVSQKGIPVVDAEHSIENSALSTYLKWVARGVRVLAGCRLLERGDEDLLEGESYIGSAYTRQLDDITAGDVENWWDTPAVAAASTPAVAAAAITPAVAAAAITPAVAAAAITPRYSSQNDDDSLLEVNNDDYRFSDTRLRLLTTKQEEEDIDIMTVLFGQEEDVDLSEE